MRLSLLVLQARIKVRVVCARAYHCLFMYNMLIRPTEEELATFGKPDFTIFNAGAFPVNRHTSYMSSSTSVDLNMRCEATCMLVQKSAKFKADLCCVWCVRMLWSRCAQQLAGGL